jgi:uncharacterized membrane protein YphA (DoxX/SURF4 family)
MTTALCVLLAGSLLTAAVAKLRDPRGFRATLRALGAPDAMAWAVPALEIALAAALAGGGGRAAAAGTIVLLAAFTLVLGRLGDVPCRCFGAGSDGDARAGQVRNLALGALALALVARPAAPLWDAGARELAGAATVAAGLTCVWLLTRARAVLAA